MKKALLVVPIVALGVLGLKELPSTNKFSAPTIEQSDVVAGGPPIQDMLNSERAGLFVIETGTNFTDVAAEIVSANSRIFTLTTSTTTVAGRTCTGTPQTSSVAETYPGTGFRVSVPSIVQGDPVCGYFFILK